MKQNPHCVFPLHELIRFPKEITGDGLIQFTRLLLHHANLVGSKISSILNTEGSLRATMKAGTELAKQGELGKGQCVAMLQHVAMYKLSWTESGC